MAARKLLVAVIIMFACLSSSIALNIYTPSLSAIAHNFRVQINTIQYSMVIFMLGFACLQLFYGPISEVIGRRTPLITGLLLISIGSIICLFAPNVTVLFIGRFIQGCGAAAGPLFRSIFRDMFKNEELAKYGSYVSIIMTLVISVSPTIGGYLQHYINWQASFVFIGLYSLISLVLIKLFMQETSQHHSKQRAQIGFVLKTFKEIITNGVFMGYSLACLISYGAFFAWFVTGPVLLIHVLKLSPVTFGWITFFGGGLTMTLAGIINARLVGKLGIKFMLQLGWSLMIIAGLIMLAGNFLFGMNAIAIVAPIIVFYFGVTLLWANLFAAAFSPLGHIAGYAGAIYGFMQISGGALLGAIMAHLPDNNQIPLALVFVIAPSLAWFIYRVMARPTTES